MSHTPAPWRVIEHGWSSSGIYDASNRLIARCEINPDVTEETQAHYEKVMNEEVNLLASAPKLLKALQDILALKGTEENEWYKGDTVEVVMTKMCKIASEAIAEYVGGEI